MTSDDLFQAAAKASPPVAYVGVTFAHVSLPDWVAFATLVYILLQTANLLWRWRKSSARGSDSPND